MQSLRLPYIRLGGNTGLSCCLRELFRSFSYALKSGQVLSPADQSRETMVALTYVRQSQHRHHVASELKHCKFPSIDPSNKCCNTDERTIAAVISRQIPLPPPVQNSTFPLKIFGLKIDVESVTGATKATGAIAISFRIVKVIGG